MNSRETDKLYADLSAYLDDELNAARRDEIDALLSRSASARALLEDLRHISRGLAGLPRAAAPSGIAEQVLQQATGHSLAEDLKARRRLLFVQVASRAAASAAVVVLCVIGGWVLLVKPAAEPGRSNTNIVETEIAGRGIESGRNSERGGEITRRNAGREPVAPRSPARTLAPETVASGTRKLPATPGLGGSGAAFENKQASAELRELHALGYSESAFRAPAPADQNVPESVTVAADIVVQARGDDDYAELTSVVDSYQAAGSAAYGLAFIQVDELAAGTHEAMVQLPAGRLGEFVESLEQHAPGQVQVSMQFRGGDYPTVQRMLGQGERMGVLAFDNQVRDKAVTADDAVKSESADSSLGRQGISPGSAAGDRLSKTARDRSRLIMAFLPWVSPWRWTPPTASSPTPAGRVNASENNRVAENLPAASATAAGAAPPASDRAEDEQDSQPLVTAAMLKAAKDSHKVREEKRPIVADADAGSSGAGTPRAGRATYRDASRSSFAPEAAESGASDMRISSGGAAKGSIWSGVLRRAESLTDPILQRLESLGQSVARATAALEAQQEAAPVLLRVQVLRPNSSGEAVLPTPASQP